MPTASRLPALLALLAGAMIVAAGCTAAPVPNSTAPTATRCAACEGTPTPNASAPLAPFNGTTWEWRALEVGGDVVAVDDPANYTVVFTENGTYGINADCNVGAGDYTATDRRLNLTPPITTLIWCGEESQDRIFLASLANVSSYSFDGEGRLLLGLAVPGECMVLAARDAGAAPGAAAARATAT